MGLGSENPGFAKLENLFSGGALEGKAGLIVQTALDNGVNPELFAAIIAHETGRGTSNAVQNYNNPAGIMDPKTKWTKLKKFETIEDGLNYSAKNLKRRLDQVGGDFNRLANVYAPINADNDPSGLNKNWSLGVKKFMDGLKTGQTIFNGQEEAEQLLPAEIGGDKVSKVEAEQLLPAYVGGRKVSKEEATDYLFR